MLWAPASEPTLERSCLKESKCSAGKLLSTPSSPACGWKNPVIQSLHLRHPRHCLPMPFHPRGQLASLKQHLQSH